MNIIGLACHWTSKFKQPLLPKTDIFLMNIKTGDKLWEHFCTLSKHVKMIAELIALGTHKNNSVKLLLPIEWFFFALVFTIEFQIKLALIVYATRSMLL